MRKSWETMTSVSAGHIIQTPTQPVGSGRPQNREEINMAIKSNLRNIKWNHETAFKLLSSKPSKPQFISRPSKNLYKVSAEVEVAYPLEKAFIAKKEILNKDKLWK